MASAPGAFAADVDIYGVIDLGLHYAKSSSAPHAMTMDSGITKGSRFGFKGKENLGNGYAAFFMLESGITADGGAMAGQKNGTLFDRVSSLGGTAPWGRIEVGRLGALGSGVTGSIFLNGFTPFGNLYKEAQALQVKDAAKTDKVKSAMLGICHSF